MWKEDGECLTVIMSAMFASILLLLSLLLTPLEFFTSALTDGFSLEFEWQQVSSSLQDSSQYSSRSQQWMVSTRPPTSKSFSPFNNPLETVPKAPITIGVLDTFMFHSFLNCLAWSRYLCNIPMIRICETYI